jgi:VWFA-related protein
MSGISAKGLGISAVALVAASYVVSGFLSAASAKAVSRTQQPQTPPPPAQQPQTPQPLPQPTFRTEANYVRVDVYPTKDGAPLTDLVQEDFEIVEGGAPQKIEQFERVVIEGNVPQDLRREPNSVEAGRQAAQNPRARVFVIFLDVNHVEVEGSHNIRRPLVDALNRLIGPEDVFAVMTPEMSAGGITFARKTTTIEGELSKYWTWGQRDRLLSKDDEEEQYKFCYPGNGPTLTCTDDDRGVADEMIERRRERQTLNALHDLVTYLRGVREERKAVLVITDGWRLFRPNTALARRLNCQVPTGPQVTIDPRTGRPTSKPTPNTPGRGITNTAADPQICERDRMALAMLEDEQYFRDLLQEANRANASFYPIDPRGLVVFDEPIAKPGTRGFQPMTPLTVDASRLRGRLDSLRTLAENTDGLAIVDSNNLAGGMKRVVADLSSYYLLGYYSNAKLDGRYHAITVRVKRPGVQVRARKGYLAATPDAMTAGRGRGPAAPKAGDPGFEAKVAADAAAAAVSAAIGPLAGYTREVPLRVQMAVGWKPGDAASAVLWVVGELGGAADAGPEWNAGFDASATLTTPADVTVATGRLTAARGARTFRMALTPSQPLAAGEYILRVGARAGPSTIPSREVLRFAIPEAPASAGALFIRRGPTTGNKEVPTADLRFRRSESVRLEIPTSADAAGTARLLDRTGKPLAVPVAAAIRDDADGSRWQTAQLALAPLAPGDYVIEIANGERRMLSAFRIVP